MCQHQTQQLSATIVVLPLKRNHEADAECHHKCETIIRLHRAYSPNAIADGHQRGATTEAHPRSATVEQHHRGATIEHRHSHPPQSVTINRNIRAQPKIAATEETRPSDTERSHINCRMLWPNAITEEQPIHTNTEQHNQAQPRMETHALM